MYQTKLMNVIEFFQENKYTRKVTLPLAGFGLSCLIGSVMTGGQDQIKIPLAVTGATSSFISYALQRNIEEREEILRAVKQNQVNAYSIQEGMSGIANALQQKYYAKQEPAALPKSLPPVAKALRSLLAARDKFSFIILLAAQGQGKTYTATAMQALSKPGTVSFVISPHVKPGDFPAADYVVQPETTIDTVNGDITMLKEYYLHERDCLSDSENYDLTLTDLAQTANESGVIRSSIWQAIISLFNEYVTRKAYCQTEGNSADNLQPLDFYLDEAPATYLKLGMRKVLLPGEGDETKVEDLWRKMFISPAMMEFRKYKLRVILITQSKTIDNLGMKGNASLRDEYTFIRLGSAAVDHAKSISLNPAEIACMEDVGHSMMIDDVPYGSLDSAYVEPMVEAWRGCRIELQPLKWDRPIHSVSPVPSSLTPSSGSRPMPAVMQFDSVSLLESLSDEELEGKARLFQEGLAQGFPAKSKEMKKHLGLPTGNGAQSKRVSEELEQIQNYLSIQSISI
jgi:hypothetical protein